MADRRMLTKKVTDDDNFMGLSSSAQALYLHLSMAADDDGFCNQVSLCMFKAHASVQDLEALLSKRYIYQFENGVIVIKHWRMANALRKDRYTPTAFQEELSMLRLKDNGSYTWLPDGCQVVAERLPQARLDKDRIDKDRSIEASGLYVSPSLPEIESFARERNSPVDPKRFFTHYEGTNWTDKKGKPIRDWKKQFMAWEAYERKQKPTDRKFPDFDDSKADEQLDRLLRKMNEANH